MANKSDFHRSAPAFPWNALGLNAVIAAVVALVIGTVCYHFLADQDWGEAAGSSFLWAGLAIIGVGIGHAIAHFRKASRP